MNADDQIHAGMRELARRGDPIVNIQRPFWILDNRVPRAATLDEYAAWRSRTDRDPCRVAETFMGKVHVSSVFLAVDHNFGGHGSPILFETMIFGGTHNEEQFRYATWAEAERGHAQVVAMLEREDRSTWGRVKRALRRFAKASAT